MGCIALRATQEDATVKRDAPGAIVIHEVADYAKWKRAYDGDTSARTRAGIIGTAVNRVVDAPQKVVIYLQAETADALRAFTSSDDLKSTMKDAGVVGPPHIAFVNGSSWASY